MYIVYIMYMYGKMAVTLLWKGVNCLDKI
jgi:hypothetical protein